MASPMDDPFEAFKKKKAEQEERKRQQDEEAAERDAEAARAAEIAAEEEEEAAESGEPILKKPLLTRKLRKVSKKGEVKDLDRPAGFDSHRFEGTKHGDEAEGGERPHGMKSDRFDTEEEDPE